MKIILTKSILLYIPKGEVARKLGVICSIFIAGEKNYPNNTGLSEFSCWLEK
jgi:hypothetical protein